MTTAHRPTWKAAVGRASEGGYAGISALKSVRDEAGHTKLKVRAGPQVIDKQKHLQESLLKLNEAERKHKESLRRAMKAPPVNPQLEAESRQKLLLHDKSRDVDDQALRLKYNDADADADDDDDAGANNNTPNENRGTAGWSDIDGNSSESDLDADSDDDSDNDNSDLDDDNSNDDDSEDEEAALQAELAKIKQEREAVKQKKAVEQERQDNIAAEEAALTGNPLLNPDGMDASMMDSTTATSAKIKRKWNDDVVFRNQARSASGGGLQNDQKKRFINDTVRNDFHKRFLNKFIR